MIAKLAAVLMEQAATESYDPIAEGKAMAARQIAEREPAKDA
jgi:hypothetical protein